MSALLPLVSVIISSYNSEKFIRGKLEDLLSQTIFEQLEIIIIISGSEQQEEKIVDEYYKKYRNIKLIITDKRESIYTSWNKGIKMSRGKYITNSNTDDRLREDAFEVMVEYLENKSTVGLVYADQYYSFIENETFKKLSNKIKFPKPDYKYLLLLERCIIGSQPMWRREIHFQKGIWFDEKYEVAGDYDFELRIAKKYKIYHIPQVLGVYYKSPEMKNKEYENFDKTFAETFKINDFYIRDYINEIGKEKLNNIIHFLEFKIKIPGFLYNHFRKYFNLLFPRLEINSRYFLFLFLSYYYEYLGDQKKAEQICADYLEEHPSIFIQKRISHFK